MTKLTGDEPVYPTPLATFSLPKGMPIRLHLAAMAMQGMLTGMQPDEETDDGGVFDKILAEEALKSADALIAAYNKGASDER